MNSAAGESAAQVSRWWTLTAAGLDASVAKTYEQKKGWLGHYRAPSSVVSKCELVRRVFGVPFDQKAWTECVTSRSALPQPLAG